MASKEGDPRPPWVTRAVQFPRDLIAWILRKVANGVRSIWYVLTWLWATNYFATDSALTFLTKDAPRTLVKIPFRLSNYVLLIETVIVLGSIVLCGGIAALAASAKDVLITPIFILALLWAAFTMWISWSWDVTDFRRGFIPAMILGILTFVFQTKVAGSVFEKFAGFSVWAYLLFYFCGTIFCISVRWYHSRQEGTKRTSKKAKAN